MIELVQIYQWTLVAALIMAPVLSLVGCQLAARERSMQTLCLGQGASVGVLLAIGLLGGLTDHTVLTDLWIFLSAALASLLTYLFTESVSKNTQASKTTYFSATFAGLMGLSYLVSAIFPALESHLATVFFGDLATLPDHEATIAIGLGVVGLLCLAYYWRAFTAESFGESVFGSKIVFSKNGPSPVVFNVLSLVLISFSIQTMGFLFTIATLFIPTSLMSKLKRDGILNHFVWVVLLSFLSTAIGFILSLRYSSLPTVPTIVLTMLLWSLLPKKKVSGYFLTFFGILLALIFYS